MVTSMRPMSAYTGQARRWARAATVWVIVAVAGCHSDAVFRASGEIDHVLRVQGDGTGIGTVTTPDVPRPLACSITKGAVAGVCGMAYPANSAVALVATPNAASVFAGWSGACTGTGQCVIDMSQERTVTAAFLVRTATERR